MTAYNDDNDDFTTPGADAGEGSSTAIPADGADDRRGDDSETEADLPQLLRQVSRALRREFRSAAADSGFDPRDFGRLRRRRWDTEDVAPDGGPYNDDPGSFSPPWARGNWGPSKNVNSEEMRQRLRDLRDSVGDRVEDVLTSEEFEHLKASLSKLADAFGAQRCEGDDDRGPDDQHGDHDRSDHDHGGVHGHDGDRDQHGRHDNGRHDNDRRRSRGRRGFGPSFGPRIGPGLGAGRRGLDPFGWVDDRRSREQEIQDAFERGFAAGFEQGRDS